MICPHCKIELNDDEKVESYGNYYIFCPKHLDWLDYKEVKDE